MITHIVGNRPQFIKLSPVYNELKRRGYTQSIIHSGQHYDKNMSDIFFEELSIPTPDINLRCGGGTHAEITGKAMIGIEKALIDLSPMLVIVYGDTDTTLAAAVAAKKLNIPIAHVEGGIRTRNMSNPEEINRIITDHISDVIFCPTVAAVDDGEMEGLGDKLVFTGDVMYDTYLLISSRQKSMKEMKDDIILMTWHRAENTLSRERMESILSFVERLPYDVICPMHPRTQNCLRKFELWEKAKTINNFFIEEPVGYARMVEYMNRAKVILTDSGGLSKESSFAGVKCLFMLDLDVWDELQAIDWIHKINPEKEEDILDAICRLKATERVPLADRPRYYGDGNASEKIVNCMFEKGLI